MAKIFFSHSFSFIGKTQTVFASFNCKRIKMTDYLAEFLEISMKVVIVWFLEAKERKWKRQADQGSRRGRQAELISETESLIEIHAKRNCSLHSTFSLEEDGIIKLETIISH